MFNKGDMVVYGQTGVCYVEEVGKSKIVKSDELYYTLKPAYASGRVYIPVNTNAYLRGVMDREQAAELVKQIPEIPEYVCPDRRLAAQKIFYQEAVHSHDFTMLVGIIKGLYQKSTRASGTKKPLTSVEEQFRKIAEDLVHQELAVSFGIEAVAVPEYIKNIVEN